MKAILEFNLPDDQEEYLRTTRATDMASVLWEIIYNLRKQVEREFEAREDARNEQSSFDAIEYIFKEIYGLMEDHNINIDTLYS